MNEIIKAAVNAFGCKKEELQYIKANLPNSETNEIQGYGEGCFFLVSPDTAAALDRDEDGTLYAGILDNDSVYFPYIMHGELLPLVTKGKQRPVVPYKYLAALNRSIQKEIELPETQG